MAESSTKNRISFPRTGQQHAFLLAVCASLDTDWKEIAQIVGVHDRTVRDWANEKTRLPHETALKLAEQSNTSLPKSVKVIDWEKHLLAASHKGGKAKYEKYGTVSGNETVRKKAWEQWWHKEGKFKKHTILEKQKVKTPPKSAKLAEFVGIMMGDGGIADYHTTVTLHAKDDRAYGVYVCSFLKDLFDVTPKVYKDNYSCAINIVVHRKALVEFCNTIGLKTGNKIRQRLDIPQWIKDNPKYAIACVRGLVDTDGSIFTHTYKVTGKQYNYKKLSFTSKSPVLCASVQTILEAHGINTRTTERGDVRIESKKDIEKYIQVFGSHNPKHLKRYRK